MRLGTFLSTLNALLAEHRWRLQLAGWAVMAVAVCLLAAGQCRRAASPPEGAGLAADSLLRLELPQCRRVDYAGFTVYFDAAHRLPRCAVYELTASETRGSEQRQGAFERDTAVPGCPAPGDYTGSGLERGHMVPAADLKWDSLAMRQSFMMTNICPQDKSLNQGGWSRLEEKVREWARRDGSLIVATGPVLEPGLPRTDGGVTIPRSFFKVVLAHRAAPMRAVAFIYPNATAAGPLRHYAVTVDSVERLTGIDFFPALPDEVEKRVEARQDLASFLH